jgi:polyisoprenoid-binding protein YceI
MKKTLFGIAVAAAFVGCSKNPAENVPAADVKSPATTNAAPAAAGRSYAFDGSNSKVEFVGSKVTGKHDGGFRQFVGEVNVVNGKLADTGNKVVIDVNSMHTDNDRLTGHLKNADFFDAPRFPTATFVTTEVKAGETNATITGNLTLHGVTKQITFPADIKVSDDSVTVKAEFFLNRFDFDMKYPGKADDLIRKEVVLKLDVKAAPGKADFSKVEKTPAQPSA